MLCIFKEKKIILNWFNYSQCPEIFFSRSRNSDAFALECLENYVKMFP